MVSKRELNLLDVYDEKELLTLNLLTTTIVEPPSNASKWQMGFNSAFKGVMIELGEVLLCLVSAR